MNFRRRNIRIVARFTMENPPQFQLSFTFYLFTFLPFYFFNVRNQDILINLTIVLMGSKAERYRH